jgi:hypothetical protein
VWELREAAGLDAAATRRAGGPVTIGFIGQPRPERCFDVFVLAALAMEAERRAGAVRFLVVVQPGALAFWRMTKFADVLGAGLPGIAIEERWMSAADFAREMDRADVVWAVGEPGAYRRQTSGIFAHALALGKSIIANRGGWAEAVGRGLPGLRFIDPTVGASRAAIRSLLQAPPTAGAGRDTTHAVSTRAMFDDFVRESLEALA